MTSDRRYSDDEVARIFARAVEQHGEATDTPREPAGMTLAQLQAIAAEAGIEPTAVERAARELEAPPAPAMPTILGVVTAAAHSVELPRRLSDDEWERFVVRLRQVFAARGELTGFGSLRSWSNGNLQVHVEPGVHGSTVRFYTRRGEAGALIRFGGWMALGTLPITVINLSAGTGFNSGVIAAALATAAGFAVSLGGILRTGHWRRTRQQQFEALGAELLRATR